MTGKPPLTTPNLQASHADLTVFVIASHMVLHGKVYAIAPFLDEHPGGDEVLLGECGRDATEAFEDVGHSDEAREMLSQYLVGVAPEVSRRLGEPGVGLWRRLS